MITYYSSFSKEDWRGFSKSIESMTKDGDIVVFAPGYISQPFDYYYSNTTDKTLEFGSIYKKRFGKNIISEGQFKCIHYRDIGYCRSRSRWWIS